MGSPRSSSGSRPAESMTVVMTCSGLSEVPLGSGAPVVRSMSSGLSP